MRKCRFLGLYLTLLALPALATPAARSIPYEEAVDRLVIPVDSPVQHSAIGKDEGTEIITFKERFLLTGTYVYGDNDFNDSGDENPAQYQFEPQAYIIPDKALSKRMPYFASRNGGQYTVFISNPAAFAKATVPPAAARRVRCRNCGVATGHIAMWVDRFRAQLVCDSPDYAVRFLSIEKPARAAIIRSSGLAC